MIIPKNVWPSVIKVSVILLCLKNFQAVRSACTNDDDWECDNGQCIPEEFLCNGKVDCSDRSDEIAENCIQNPCQDFAFHCAYGACIEGKSRCNGVQDCADNSDELTCANHGDSYFQGICSDSEMQCSTSKECIDINLVCNGVANCKDGSDESIEVCINYVCKSIGIGFQCGYGACIDGKSKCNGTVECLDGSDEAWLLCNTERKKNNLINVTPTPTPKPKPTPTPIPETTPSQARNCFLPNFPDLQNLIFKLHPQNQTIELGSIVEEYEILHIECKNGKTLRGTPSLICRNEEFNNDFPTCDSYCDGKALSSLSLRAICDYKDDYVKCPEKIPPGTFIQVKCAFGYYRRSDAPQNLRCLSNGNFNEVPMRCEMNCGRVSPPSTALSQHGIEIPISKAPWHVAIYEDNRVRYNYICGGSIVSPTVIISAAHCFWDEANQIPKNFLRYQIIAGRATKNYTTEQTDFSQVVKAKEVHIPVEYRGKDGRQRDDIAFMKLEIPLRFSETIAPICLSKDLRITATSFITSNRDGLINGFGSNNNLERVNMKTLDYYECVKKSPTDAPVAEDKFCAYTSDNALVCRGDSGGGFSSAYTDQLTGVTTYSLLGVISNTPNTKNDCTRTGDQSYVAITNIFYAPPTFKQNLIDAKTEDEKLF